MNRRDALVLSFGMLSGWLAARLGAALAVDLAGVCLPVVPEAPIQFPKVPWTYQLGWTDTHWHQVDR